MAIHSGKPGSRRVTGIQRAQFIRVNALIESLLQYNAKLTVRVPPIPFISAPDVISLGVTQVVAQKYLDQVN